MVERVRWQFCQIEISTDGNGILKQFFADRPAVEHNLRDNWPSMVGKLGDQGWELVNVFPNEGGRGRNPLTYVFKRPATTPIGAQPQSSPATSAPPPSVTQHTAWQQQPPATEDDDQPDMSSPLSGFEPLRD